ncbi:hypothetical protein THAOC_04611 [Thalassiosira oceanica]|uniref:Secreted protein n=1 Tax=Thalassiosira oceanica TaxID=159749 RepID=K0TIW6_THAOC|nr:hypothetical protein THAOC_04611 [Thalassiosira oceanica]|eukprot:EJK73746.1 hypothetical protein THAOC_04611 [Thalassiosira oceanica]
MIIFVLCLVDTIVGLLGIALDPHGVQEFVPRSVTVEPAVRQDDRRAATTEECVLQEEATLVAVVKVWGDDFGGNHESLPPAEPAALKEVLRESYRDERCAAPHPAKVEGLDACLIPNLDITMAQRLGVGLNRLQLMTRTSTSLGCSLAFFRALSTMSNMTVSASFLLAEIDLSVGLSATPLQQPLHEFYAIFVEAALVLHHLNNLLVANLPGLGRLEGGECEKLCDNLVHDLGEEDAYPYEEQSGQVRSYDV